MSMSASGPRSPLPGMVPGATRRNVVVVLVYLFVLLLLTGAVAMVL